MGLGLYDYYVDTLSTVARVLRFFMGIPGGSKEHGIRLLQRAIREGQLTPAIARFYLAINLHNYDQRYEEALQVLTPLVQQYPGNAIFLLAQGDLYAKLGRKPLALEAYRAAQAAATKLRSGMAAKNRVVGAGIAGNGIRQRRRETLSPLLWTPESDISQMTAMSNNREGQG